jgi:hypothetical protein
MAGLDLADDVAVAGQRMQDEDGVATVGASSPHVS